MDMNESIKLQRGWNHMLSEAADLMNDKKVPTENRMYWTVEDISEDKTHVKLSLKVED